MFDSPVLNTVIGLTLIYLLYSLLASILSEMLSTMFNLRSVLLRVALERMLNDGYYAKKQRWHNGLNAVVNGFRWFFLSPNRDFKNSLAGRFYEHPSIKYLSKVDGWTWLSERRPSYLTDVYFVSTLTRMLIEMGLGNDDKEKIASALKLNTLHMQKRTAENIISIHHEAGGEVEPFKEGLRKWYNETMDRTNGWYKRKMQALLLTLGLFLSILFNVDSIRIAKILARDPQARAQMVEMSIAISKDPAYEKTIANKDTANRATILDSGYANVQRDLDDARMILGLGWNTSNLTSPVTYELERGKDAVVFQDISALQEACLSLKRADSVARASQQKNELAVKLLQTEIQQTDREIFNLRLEAQTAPIKDDSSGVKKTDTSGIKTANEKRERRVKELAMRLTILKNDSTELAVLTASQQQNLRNINRLTGQKFTQVPVFEKAGTETLKLEGKGPFRHKTGYIFSSIFKDYRLLGFLLTALMISLGAPFWFDLLKKLVNLRGAGVKPEPTPELTDIHKLARTAEGHVAADVARPETPLFANIQDEFVFKYRARLLALPPVRAVFSFYDNEGQCKVQINVTIETAVQEVTTFLQGIGAFTVPSWLFIKVTGIPKSSGRYAVGNAHNFNITNGSLSCILKDSTNEDRFVLSCWHVLKGDINFDATSIEFPFVVDNNAMILGELEAGGILSTLDYGLARCRPDASIRSNTWLTNLLKLPADFGHRAVEMDDLKKHISVRYFDDITQTVISGVLYTVSKEVQVDYRDKSRMVHDVLVIMKGINTALPISIPGNSGSLLFDDKHNAAIGMIIAGDDNYTYAIKLSNFFELHKEKSFA